MTLQQRQRQCERDNAFNAQRERQIKLEASNNRKGCTPTGAGKYAQCCAISPVAPTPVVPGCPCEPSRPPSNRFCTRVRGVCERVELTPYGKAFACNTGKIPQQCQCVKFNGLQDSCRHPGCFTKIGCNDNPFPNCPPAKQWKNEYQRHNRQNDKC